MVAFSSQNSGNGKWAHQAIDKGPIPFGTPALAIVCGPPSYACHRFGEKGYRGACLRLVRTGVNGTFAQTEFYLRVQGIFPSKPAHIATFGKPERNRSHGSTDPLKQDTFRSRFFEVNRGPCFQQLNWRSSGKE